MTRNQKQPRLLPATAPMHEGDALSFSDLTTRYRCRCGNTAETGIRLDAVVVREMRLTHEATMTAYQLDDALTELELLADQLERVEPDLTRSPVTEARLFASTLRYSQRAWASSEGRAEAVADTRKVYGLLAYLAAHLTKQAVQA